MEKMTRIGIPSLERPQGKRRRDSRLDSVGLPNVKRARREGRHLIEKMIEHENELMAAMDAAHAAAAVLLNEYHNFFGAAHLSGKVFEVIEKHAKLSDTAVLKQLNPRMREFVLKYRGLLEVQAEVLRLSKKIDQHAFNIDKLVAALDSASPGVNEEGDVAEAA